MSQTGDEIQPITLEGAESPFLPGTRIQYAWDSTCLGYLKRCPRLYYYSIIMGWRPKDESVHLRFGQEYHSGLEIYDKNRHAGIKHEENLHATVKALLLHMTDWDPDHQYKNKRTLIRTVIGYLDKFKNDHAKTLVMQDGKLACEQSFRFELDWGPATEVQQQLDEVSKDHDGPGYSQPYLLCGHLDRVVEWQDAVFVMDRKTTKGTPGSYYFDQFQPENQMSLYTLAGQVIFQAPVRGVIIDVAQVAIEFSRFERGFTYRTSDQIDEWVNDLRYWFALAEQYAKANYWPMNDTACGQYGGCRFRDICSKSPQVREKFLAGNFNKEAPWNPLIPR